MEQSLAFLVFVYKSFRKGRLKSNVTAKWLLQSRKQVSPVKSQQRSFFCLLWWFAAWITTCYVLRTMPFHHYSQELFSVFPIARSLQLLLTIPESFWRLTMPGWLQMTSGWSKFSWSTFVFSLLFSLSQNSFLKFSITSYVENKALQSLEDTFPNYG